MQIRLIETPLAIGKYRQVRLPTVAAEFAPFCDVTINDENIEPVDFSPVDAVGITAQAYNAKRAIAIAAEFRKRNIPVIAGGPYATAMGEKALVHFDAVVMGEVEGLGETIARDLDRGKLCGVYRSGAPPVQWGMAPPRRDLQKAGKYYWVNYPMEFSRGCPHRCSFCFCRHGQPGYRPRPLAGIEADLANWDHGLIEAVDFHFAANREHAINVCRVIEQARVWGWYGEATLMSLKDPGLVSAMAKSGCKAIFVGVESIEPAALSAANKSFNQVNEYRDIIRRVQDQGIFVHAGLVWGLSGQGRQCFAETARFCEETGIYLASTNIATYFPGTPEFVALCKEQKITEKDERAFDGMHVVVKHDTLTPREITDGARDFAKRFYSISSIFQRSFQAPNYSYQQLFDFWALNLIYRAYYSWWSPRLGKTRVPWRGKDQDSYPFCGGPMPIAYFMADWSWRAFHHFYAKWLAPPKRVSLVAALSPVLLWASAGWAGFFAIQAHKAGFWPIVWPEPVIIIACFPLASWVSAWLAARAAAAGPVSFRLIAGLVALSPLFAAAAAMPRTSSGWAFLMSFYAMQMCLKTVSLAFSDEARSASFLSVAWFLLFHPSLIFDGAYKKETSRLPVARLFFPWIMAWLRVAVGTGLWVGMSWFVLYVPVFPGRAEVLALLRLFCLYFLASGLFNALVVWWRGWGFAIPDAFGSPCLFPASPSAIWRNWFSAFHQWLLRYVYVPLGGKSRQALAVMGTFLVSGLIIATAMALAIKEFPVSAALFFWVNGAVVAAEKSIGKGGRAWYALAAVAFILTAGCFFNVTDMILW